MPFCRKCGRLNSRGLFLCVNCGAELPKPTEKGMIRNHPIISTIFIFLFLFIFGAVIGNMNNSPQVQRPSHQYSQPANEKISAQKQPSWSDIQEERRAVAEQREKNAAASGRLIPADSVIHITSRLLDDEIKLMEEVIEKYNEYVLRAISSREFDTFMYGKLAEVTRVDRMSSLALRLDVIPARFEDYLSSFMRLINDINDVFREYENKETIVNRAEFKIRLGYAFEKWGTDLQRTQLLGDIAGAL